MNGSTKALLTTLGAIVGVVGSGILIALIITVLPKDLTGPALIVLLGVLLVLRIESQRG
jgi:CDP-diglyceride synthetase